MTDVVDFFCGAGGLSRGFEDAGYRVVGAVDVNDDFLDTYRKNSPSHTTVLNEDLSSIEPSALKEKIGISSVPVVIGGPPCKGFSLAGKRDKDDERNELVFHFFNHAFEYSPEIIVMENVPGILSMDVLPYVEELCDDNGYDVRYKKLDASEYGVPQSRERVVTVAIRRGSSASFSFPKPTVSSPKTVREAIVDPDLSDLPNHEDTKTNHQQSTVEALDELEFGESRYDNYSESWKRIHPDSPAPTVKENHGAPFVHPFEPRVGTVRECAILQSFPDDFEFVGSKSNQLKVVGNAVPPRLAEVVAKSIQL